MRGHITKRGEKYTVVVYLGIGLDGKKKYKWVSAGRTKRDAEKVLSELLHQVNSNNLANPKGTLGDFLERWLQEYVLSNLAPTTSEGYQDIIRSHINPALGQLPLKSLKPENIQQYYSHKLDRGLSSTTVRHHAMLLHRALQHALQWGLLARNPADAVNPPPMRRVIMRTLSEVDIEVVFQQCQNTPYYALFYLALFSGMRRSELLALRWGAVDLIGAEISVSQSFHRLKNGKIVFKSTKTKQGKRSIALSPSTCHVLREHWEYQKELLGRLGIEMNDSTLVFCQVDGEPLKPHTVSQAWRRMVRRAGLNGVRFHDTRHTHASLMLKQGVHPKIVQERLGHSSIAITLDTYSHVTPGLQQAAANRFDEILDLGISKRLAERENGLKTF